MLGPEALVKSSEIWVSDRGLISYISTDRSAIQCIKGPFIPSQYIPFRLPATNSDPFR
jgi:hypothetical protein